MMRRKRMFAVAAAISLVAVFVTLGVGCLKSDIAMVTDNIVELNAHIDALPPGESTDALRDKISELEQMAADFNERYQAGAEGWFGILDAALGVAVGFFPTLAVAVPLIRIARKVATNVVTSIEANKRSDGTVDFAGVGDHQNKTGVREAVRKIRKEVAAAA